MLGTSILLLAAWLIFGQSWLLWPLPILWAANVVISFGLLCAFYRAGGIALLLPAMLYHLLIYPLPVGLGAVIGILEYPRKGVL